MIIGDRLRELREQKKLSQREIEKRSGLLRAYLSRVENGHTVPAIETLEKWAKALEVPMYQLFYEGAEPPDPSTLRVWKSPDENTWGSSGEDAADLKKLRRFLRKLDEDKRRLILQMASRMARRSQKSAAE
jgi:transcriptional regulator with XRE-family HTH domain